MRNSKNVVEVIINTFYYLKVKIRMLSFEYFASFSISTLDGRVTHSSLKGSGIFYVTSPPQPLATAASPKSQDQQ